jgi:hypothetical protein
MNIAIILKKFDDTVIKFIKGNYPRYPRWVNKELFMIDFRKKIYNNIIERLAHFMFEENYDIDIHQLIFMNSITNPNNLSIDLYLYDDIVDYAFTSKNYKPDLNNSEMQIHLSTEFIKYIVYGITKKTSDINNEDDMYNLISNLMLQG